MFEIKILTTSHCRNCKNIDSHVNPPDSLCKYVGCFNRSETCFSSRCRRSEHCARLAFASHPNPVCSVLSSSLCCFGGVKILCLQTCGREWGNACEHQEASSYEKAKVCVLWRIDGTRQTTRYFEGTFCITHNLRQISKSIVRRMGNVWMQISATT